MKRPLGVLLYRGPSRINGKRIIVVATFKSKNDKTGNMIQTWILPELTNPVSAINTGYDVSVCGDCPMRGFIQRIGNKRVNRMRGCYVKVSNAPRAVWSAYKRGMYPVYDAAVHAQFFRGRKLRMGAYGEPVAAPLRVWLPILRLCSGHTAYTHQWKVQRFRPWRKYAMASVHSEKETDYARALGFRTFRTRTANEDIRDDEIPCPASEEAGKRLTCDECMACSGGNPLRRSLVIIDHGSPAVLGSIKRMRAGVYA